MIIDKKPKVFATLQINFLKNLTMKKSLLLLALIVATTTLFAQKKTSPAWITIFDGKNTDAVRGYKMDKFLSRKPLYHRFG